MASKESDVMKLKKILNENCVGGAYLFYGEEIFLRDIYIKKMKDVIEDNGFIDFNIITIENAQNKDAVNDAIESFPMMSEKKLVIIRDSKIFKKAKEEDTKFWNEKLSNLPSYCILLFIEDEIDKRNSIYKTIQKTGTVTNFMYLKPYELAAWVQREVLKEKIKMDKSVIEYFISICPQGLINLDNDLKKLITFCENEITKSDVTRLVSKSLNAKVFDLSDAITNKDATTALKILSDLKIVKESAFTVLYLLYSVYDKILLIKLMQEDGASYKQIESKINLSPFIFKKYMVYEKNFSYKFLKKQVLAVPEIDLQIKQGNINEWDALYRFVLDAIS